MFPKAVLIGFFSLLCAFGSSALLLQMKGGFGSSTTTGAGGFANSGDAKGKTSKGAQSASSATSKKSINKGPLMPNMENRLSIDLKYKNLKCISASPPVFEIPDFFTSEECDSYIERISQGVEIKSQTYSSGSTRTSTTWYLPYDQVPELLSKANLLTLADIANFEEPQIVRYEIGQQFSWHYDAIPASMNSNGGNRLATLLVYLNTVSGSGATVFKTLGPLQVKAEKGKALLFFPCTLDGKSDDETMHAGQVCMDTKWIAQM